MTSRIQKWLADYQTSGCDSFHAPTWEGRFACIKASFYKYKQHGRGRGRCGSHCTWLTTSWAHLSKSCHPCLSHGHRFKTIEIQHNANTRSKWRLYVAVHIKLGINHGPRLAACGCEKRVQALLPTTPKSCNGSCRTLIPSARSQVSCCELGNTHDSRQGSQLCIRSRVTPLDSTHQSSWFLRKRPLKW